MQIGDGMEIDKLKLLCGDPIQFSNVGYIYPLTIRNIKDIGGESEFNSYLNVLTMGKELAKSAFGETGDIEELSDFQIVYLFCSMDINYKNIITKALSTLLKDEVTITDYGFLVKDKIINDTNYDELTYIVKVQNCLIKASEKLEDNPANDKAKELLEKRRKARERLNKAKNNESDGEPLTLDDLVSILCANGNGINIFNVWDLSFYAFNDQFNRMKMFEDYQVNIQSLLAGANPDEMEFKHWMSKID